jgi:hypothetical protein
MNENHPRHWQAILYGKPTRRSGAVGHPSLTKLETLTTFEQALATLNPQRAKFVERYLVHGNGKLAATEAGVVSANMRLAADRIRRDSHVRHAIKLGKARVVEKLATDGLMGAEAYVKQIEEKIIKAELEGQFNAVASLLALKGKALGLLVDKSEATVHQSGYVLQIVELPPDHWDKSKTIEHDSAQESPAT